MNPTLLAAAAIALCGATTLASAGPPPGGGRYVGPHHGGAYRPYYPAVRPVYPSWRAGYWGPRAGVYVGAPAYWGGWPYPYAWGAAYAVPYAVAPIVVNAAPAPQVIVASVRPPAPRASRQLLVLLHPAGRLLSLCARTAARPWMKVVPQVPGAATTPPRLAP